MIDIPNMPNSEDDDIDSDSPARILSALSLMIRFIENLETRASMLEEMKLAPQAKWEAMTTHIKSDVPKIRKRVSKDMDAFLKMMLRAGRSESEAH